MLQEEIGGDSEKAQSETSDESKTEDVGFDMGMLLKLQELMGAMQSTDEDTKFLLALRPHVREKRQKKIDQAVKLLKIYAVFMAAKDSGMLQDLL